MPLESHFIQRSSDAWLHQAVSRRGPRFDKCGQSDLILPCMD